MWDTKLFLSAFTPNFFVALTGTASLISCLIFVFECWYYQKYGTTFIEQLSSNHINPWLFKNKNTTATTAITTSNTTITTPTTTTTTTTITTTVATTITATTATTATTTATTSSNNTTMTASENNTNNHQDAIVGGSATQTPTTSNNITTSVTLAVPTATHIPECKVWRNPLGLFRGAEYQRLYWVANKEPLTYHDMNLSAQDHQTYFTCEGDKDIPEYKLMASAWRERNPKGRIYAAQDALQINSNCASAYILLAEEFAATIVEAEKMLRTGLKVAEVNYRKSQATQHQGVIAEASHRRDTNVLIYIKRRLAMCARKLGRYKEAIKMFRDLTKEITPIVTILNIHENLIEALLATQAYADCNALVSKFDDMKLPKSATICYSAALLRIRLIADKFSSDIAAKRGLTSSEASAVEAIHRAVEFNPHVPKYLLEYKPLIFPPEHILKRGDSEAIAYSFGHLEHWKNIDGALNVLHSTWEGTFRMLPRPLEMGKLFHPYPSCTECADRELLPGYHEISVYPNKSLPFFIIFTGILCTSTAMLAILIYLYPELMSDIAQRLLNYITIPFLLIKDTIESIWPCNLLQQLSRV